MSKNKFQKDGFLTGKGFYIALAVCLVGAGTAAWAAVDRTLNAIDTAQPPVQRPDNEKQSAEDDFFIPPQTVKPTENKVMQQPKPSAESSEQPAQPSSLPASSEQSAKESDSGARQVLLPTSQSAAFCLPVNAEITNEFSGDMLVKNTTLNTWRTHNGVDFPAEKGEAVTCAFTGQVTKVYNDPMWGSVVEITGKDDLVAVYSGIEDADKLEVGAVIKSGETIGKVGDIPCESKQGSHLHFAVMQDGKYIDPLAVKG